MKKKKQLEKYFSFSEMLNDAAEAFGDRVFLVEGKKQYTFCDFNSLVNKTAGMLRENGVKKGDIISIILKNSVDYLLLYFACLRFGCVINPFPFHLGAKEIAEKLEFVGPKIVFAHASLLEALKKTSAKVIVAQEHNKDILGEMISKFPDAEIGFGQIDPEDTAFMYYSSGTTGSPKMIEYSTSSEITVMASQIRSGFIRDGDSHLVVLPLGHTAAIRYSILPCLMTGSKAVIFESFWKLGPKLWDTVKEHGITFFEVVPSILTVILNTPYKGYERSSIPSMRYIGCGSSFLAKNLQDDFEKKFDIPVANLYGLSETGPTHFDDPFEKGRKTGTIGRPFDVVEARIFDEEGKETRTGEPGEIGIKSPGLLKGYYRNREQYDACFRNGYFMTGDIGSVDENGIFCYIDRKKDLIIKGGVNIVPSQIDEVLTAHEAIREAATVGKPDMFLGETIKSFIVFNEGCTLADAELKKYCSEKLGEFKTPSFFEAVLELPKGPSGKILKRVLREKA